MGDLAAAAALLEAAGDGATAALLRAGHHRDRGEHQRAASEFEAAGRLEEAAEMHATGSDFRESAELFERAGNFARAAETYRAGGDPLAAARCYESAYDYDSALECYDEAGDDGERDRPAREDRRVSGGRPARAPGAETPTARCEISSASSAATPPMAMPAC